MSLQTTTATLIRYLEANNKVDGLALALDQARMLARDAAIPVDPTPRADEPRYTVGFQSVENKQEVVLSRISDTLAYCEEYGFMCSSQFQSIWDDLILAATAEGYKVPA